MGKKNYCAAYIFIFLQHTALMFIIVCIYFCFNHRVKTVLLFIERFLNSVKTLLPGFFFLCGCIDIEWKTVEAVSYIAVWEEGKPQGL